MRVDDDRVKRAGYNDWICIVEETGQDKMGKCLFPLQLNTNSGNNNNTGLGSATQLTLLWIKASTCGLSFCELKLLYNSDLLQNPIHKYHLNKPWIFKTNPSFLK